MAEICCGVVSGTEASSEACEPSTRTARRRRMEVRRFKFAGVETIAMPADLTRKRQKLECPSPTRPIVNQYDDGGKDTIETRIERGCRKENETSSDPSSGLNLEMPTVNRAAESSGSDQCPRYGMTSVCGRRRDMEDAIAIQPDFTQMSSTDNGRLHFFGVYDGHGCSHVAASCKDRMHEIVTDEMERVGSGWSPDAWKDVMERSFSRMDTEAVACSGGARNAGCRCELQTPKCDHVGSTAVVAVVDVDRIVVANCGDSRAVLCRKGVPIPLSSDHKPDRPDELDRIQAAGGRVIYWDGARVLGVLAMSRAIGDSYLKPFVISEPEVTITGRSEDDECLILASDGLWDVVTNEMACGIVRMCLRGNTPGAVASAAGIEEANSHQASDRACSDAAMLLTKLALARQSADNVSVVVVDLRRNTS